MSRDEALPLARKIAAAVCEIDGCSDDYVAYIREGRMDDERVVMVAVAATQFTAEHIARQNRKSNVVEMAA